jgi:hypothetical protein
MTERLEDRSKRLRETLVRELTEKFMNASGYAARVEGVNQWQVVVEALLDGVEEMIEDAREEDE